MPWRSLTGVRFILHLPQSKMDSRLSVLSEPRSTFCTEMQTEHSSNKGSNELWNEHDGLNNQRISSTWCFVEFLIRCSIVVQGDTHREHRSPAVPENETLQYCIYRPSTRQNCVGFALIRPTWTSRSMASLLNIGLLQLVSFETLLGLIGAFHTWNS